jgi:hypothetical protein
VVTHVMRRDASPLSYDWHESDKQEARRSWLG